MVILQMEKTLDINFRKVGLRKVEQRPVPTVTHGRASRQEFEPDLIPVTCQTKFTRPQLHTAPPPKM